MRVDLTAFSDHKAGKHCMFCAVTVKGNLTGMRCSMQGKVMDQSRVMQAGEPLCPCISSHLPPASAMAGADDWSQAQQGVGLNVISTSIMKGEGESLPLVPGAYWDQMKVASPYHLNNGSDQVQVGASWSALAPLCFPATAGLNPDAFFSASISHDPKTCPVCVAYTTAPPATLIAQALEPQAVKVVPEVSSLFDNFDDIFEWWAPSDPLQAFQQLAHVPVVALAKPESTPPTEFEPFDNIDNYLTGFNPAVAGKLDIDNGSTLQEVVELFVQNGGQLSYQPGLGLKGIYVVDGKEVTSEVLKDYLTAKIKAKGEKIREKFSSLKVTVKGTDGAGGLTWTLAPKKK